MGGTGSTPGVCLNGPLRSGQTLVHSRCGQLLWAFFGGDTRRVALRLYQRRHDLTLLHTLRRTPCPLGHLSQLVSAGHFRIVRMCAELAFLTRSSLLTAGVWRYPGFIVKEMYWQTFKMCKGFI